MSWLCLSLLPKPHHLVSSTSLQTDLIYLETRGVQGPATEDNQGHSRESPSLPHPTHTPWLFKACWGRGDLAPPGGAASRRARGPLRMEALFPLSLILPRGLGDQTGVSKGARWGAAYFHFC